MDEPTAESTPPPATPATEDERALIDIDFRALIDLLSHHLYRDKSAVIRELLSNANDSLIARARAFDFGDDQPMIRLWLDHQAARLVIQDNGIGMSRSDLRKYLATIGASLTRRKREADPQALDGLIGNFGVGFLSSFIVADTITVETRYPDAPGCRWRSYGERSYEISDLPEAEIGTTVLLDLKPEIRSEWRDEQIKKMVLENARNFDFPIYWGPESEDQLNSLRAPWYDEPDPADRSIDHLRTFLAEYDERFASAANATEIVLLRDDNVRGVVYVPAAAALQHDKVGVVDLYCKRVFVTRDDSQIVPEEFSFVKGVIDCSTFRLTASRDDVIRDDYSYAHVRRLIGVGILDHLRALAQRADADGEAAGDGPEGTEGQLYRLRLQSFMDQYSNAIKNALVQNDAGGHYLYGDEYLRDLEGFVLFESSLLANTTIPDYLKRMAAAGRPGEILLLRPKEDYVAHRAISEQEKREFLLVRFPMEEEYVKRYAGIAGVACISAADELKKSFSRIEPDGGWVHIVSYYRDRLNHPEFSLSVHLAEFQPEPVFARLVAEQDSEGSAHLRQLIEQMEAGGLDQSEPIFQELKRLKSKQPHVLFLNRRNPVLRRLAELLEQNVTINLDQILHSIFHDVAIAAGHQIHELHLAEYQSRTYGDLLSGLRFEDELKLSRERLAETKERLQKLELKNAELLENLAHLDGPGVQTRHELTDDVFFIRPMHEAESFHDYVSKKAAEICDGAGLRLIDPKALSLPGNILDDILDYLRKSRLVIADVSEIENANVYYEVGFVYGAYPQKLILIADKAVVGEGRLPFDIKVQRVLTYTKSAADFELFLTRLKEVVNQILESQED